MKGLKLGRIHYKNDMPYVKGANKRLAWGMDHYLAAILRDYIRMVEKDEYHIGLAVFSEEEIQIMQSGKPITWDDEAKRRLWHKLLLDTADMFDQYLRADYLYEDIDYEKLVNNAFENIKKIFISL